MSRGWHSSTARDTGGSHRSDDRYRRESLEHDRRLAMPAPRGIRHTSVHLQHPSFLDQLYPPEYPHPPDPDDDGLDDFDRRVLAQNHVPSQPQNDDSQYRIALDHLSRHAAPHVRDYHVPDRHGTYYDTPASQPTLASAAHLSRPSHPEVRVQHSPRTMDIINREPTHRLREIQVARQLETPPMYSVPPIQSPPPSEASSQLLPGSSSPATRVAARKQYEASARSSSRSSLSMEVAPATPSVRSTQSEHSIRKSSTPVIHGIPLVNIREALPDRFRSAFPYELFNAVQSKCFEVVYRSTDNVVVAAPTGSGKTAIMELAICKLALDRGNENFKIVYQAPTKALCSERARDWEKKFSHMNLKCAELTGDTSQQEMRRVGDASIIVTTPEKWDSITRKWQDHRKLLQLVELFLIDEVHILKDIRGATLEAVVSRMKTIGANVRFIALSATVPNSDDIARWLGRNHTTQQLPAHRETFGEELRPVKLQKFVYGYECNGNEFIFDKFLDSKLPSLLVKHSRRKPILIFCFTRKSVESTATMLAEYAAGQAEDGNLWPAPSQRIAVLSRELQEIVKYGVAFHHAGLDIQDRNAVEQSFLNGHLSVICCTSTLAVGINLPCHTVVLKGTVGYSDDRIQEYSDLEVMQMLGRAGRPQFDDSATAIILTRQANKERYEKMVSGQEILESTLHLNLIEHLNSEVCLGTISDLASAKAWLAGTFLSVRLRRNPDHYRLTGDVSSPSQIDDKLEEICERDIKLLQKAELVASTTKFKCTEYGNAMSKYMVEFPTMQLLLQIPRGCGMEQLITILSQAAEFKEFRFKPAERALFREINRSPLIMYPINDTVNQTHHKISLMIQSHLGCIQYPDTNDAAKMRRQLVMEKKLVFERLQRLVRAVIECKAHDRDGIATRNALELVRALSAESWEGRATQLTQIPNIGPVGMRKLASKDVRTVLQLAEKDSVDIERLMSRQPPFGKKILDSLEAFPRLDFSVTTVGRQYSQPGKRDVLTVNAKATLRHLNHKAPPYWMKKVPAVTFFAESSDGTLQYFWRGTIKKINSHGGFDLNFTVDFRHFSDYITCHFTCEGIVGTIVSKILEHGLPESAFPSRSTQQSKDSQVSHASDISAEMDYLDQDGIDDSDLLQVVEEAMAAPLTEEPKKSKEEEMDEYPLVDELLEVVTPERELEGQPFKKQHATDNNTEADGEADQYHDREPVKLPNGKWQCNHACTGGAPTKAGKPCTHKCCQEGLDRPRKRQPPKPKKRPADDELDRDIITNSSGTGNSQPTAAAPKVAKTVPNSQLSQSKLQSKLQFQPVASKTKTTSDAQAPACKKLRTEAWKKREFDDVDIECVDLSLEDEDGLPPIGKTPKGPQAAFRATQANGTSKTSSDLFVTSSHSHGPSSSGDLPVAETVRTNSGSVTTKLQKQSDFFEGDDLSFDDLMILSGSLPKQPFKQGASDEVLYQSNLNGGSDVEFSDQLSPVNHQTLQENMRKESMDLDDFDVFDSAFFDDDIPMMAVVEERERAAMVKCESSPQIQESGFSPSSADTAYTIEPHTPSDETKHEAVEEKKVTIRQEGEPQWIEEFDPELVNYFRGSVTFV